MEMTSSKPIRLVIVEDHELVRIGLRSLLDKIDAIEVVAEATSALVVARNAKAWNPDVVLMDIYLPEGNGLVLCREIRATCPSARVLFFSAYCDHATVQAAILAGASGFLDKTVAIHCLVDAIKAVAQGHAYFGGPASNMIFNLLRASGEEGVTSPALSTT